MDQEMRYTTWVNPNIKKFEDAALSAFAFLSSYGFRHCGSRLLIPQFQVYFRNNTTEVTLFYEIGSSPEALLGRLEIVDGKEYDVEYYSLGFLLAERAPHEEWEYPCELNDPGLPAAIERQAVLVERYAKDVLEGDFSIFPKLKLLGNQAFLVSSFRFLERYGFALFSTEILPANVIVRFRSETVEVKIHYKLGRPPRVEIGRLASVDGQKKTVES